MNILIIDDEPLVLDNVSKQVCEMGFDFHRVDCASNTTKADELLENNNYDVFLCDIVMPGEDGISFAKRTLQENKDCKFIFLTAHADYEYMKEAISIQSFDYVLQPATKDELRAVISNAITQLKIERKNKQLMQLGMLFKDEQEDIIDGNSMRYLLGLTDNDSFLRHLIEDKTGLNSSDQIIIPVLGQVISTTNQWNETDRSLLRSIYNNVIDELTMPIESKNIVVLRSDKEGSFILLLCFTKDQQVQIETIADVLNNIRTIFHKSLKIFMALYYSEPCAFSDLKKAFVDIVNEQNNNVSMKSNVFFVGQLTKHGIDEYSLESQKREWKIMLEKGEMIRFKESVLRLVNFKRGAEGLNRNVLMRIHQTVSELILGHMVVNNISSKDIFDNEFSYTDFMYCWETIERFTDALNSVVSRIYKLGEGGDVITDVRNYISSNLNRDLLVSEIAAYIGMNPEYLTRYFKRETGLSIKKYIDNERISSARQLLETTEISVTEIAEMVGYSNYGSFVRGFKLHTGITPSEYRKNDIKSENEI